MSTGAGEQIRLPELLEHLTSFFHLISSGVESEAA